MKKQHLDIIRAAFFILAAACLLVSLGIDSYITEKLGPRFLPQETACFGHTWDSVFNRSNAA
jgi:hypothetical protein